MGVSVILFPMEDEKYLIELNKRGIFLGPKERSDLFFQRASNSTRTNPNCEVLLLLEKMFDARPDWVNVEVKSKGLFPWEGAATWIDENQIGQRIALVRIKPNFYSSEEVLAHEFVHAMRLQFDESRFEEILAYHTSKSRLRRWIGPLFSNPNEVKGFIFSALVSWSGFFLEELLEMDLLGNIWLFMPFFVLSFACMRLFKSYLLFGRTLKKLGKTVVVPDKSLALALRLSDAEIKQFSYLKPDEIREFAQRHKEKSLRWRQLFVAYFR